MSKRAREKKRGWVDKAGGGGREVRGTRRVQAGGWWSTRSRRGCEWSNSVEALARRSAIIGAVACVRRRTIDSSECKLLTLSSLSLSLSFSPYLSYYRLSPQLPVSRESHSSCHFDTMIIGLEYGNSSRCWIIAMEGKQSFTMILYKEKLSRNYRYVLLDKICKLIILRCAA